MRSDFLDRWSRLDSPIHRMGSTLKCGLALSIVVSIVVTPLPRGPLFAGYAVFLAVVAQASRIPFSFLLLRLVMLEPFVAGVALLSVFQPGGASVAIGIALRSTLCLGVVILLTSTTPFSEILKTLRKLRFPGILLTVLALLYRYLFVLQAEAQRMQRARGSRTFCKDKPRLWRSLAALVGQLFVRSTSRAERIYEAMCARGWR